MPGVAEEFAECVHAFQGGMFAGLTPDDIAAARRQEAAAAGQAPGSEPDVDIEDLTIVGPARGVPVELVNVMGAPHGFDLFSDGPIATRWLDHQAAALRARLATA